MADQVLRAEKLAGRFVCDNAVNDEHGYLLVEQRSDGKWYDAELDASIEAFEIAPVKNLEVLRLRPEDRPLDAATEIFTIIEDDQHGVFVPDPGECQRVGIPVKRLAH
jgi:hypothetical protein